MFQDPVSRGDGGLRSWGARWVELPLSQRVPWYLELRRHHWPWRLCRMENEGRGQAGGPAIALER